MLRSSSSIQKQRKDYERPFENQGKTFEYAETHYIDQKDLVSKYQI